jgi:glycosyltransferase involved in cell wall biosynthesis
MKVLHVMKILPYPANDGFSADIWDRIQSMKRLGYTIHVLITTGNTGLPQAALEKFRATVDRVDLVPRSSSFRSVLTAKPTLMMRNSTLSSFPLHEQYDLVLAESEHVAAIFSNRQLRTRVRAIRVHNNENKYMWELASVENRLGWKLFFALEALRYGLYLRGEYRDVDCLWFISKQELERSSRRELGHGPKRYWLPPSVTLNPPGKNLYRKPGQVLFVGGLKNALNREGVRWYLKEVHPRLLSIPEYELVIAGNASGSSEAHSLAQEAEQEPRTTVHLNLENLEPLYESCALMINPMRRGSGVKMKTIHAIQRRVPLVTTGVGAEGSGFADRVHIRIADSPEGFAAAVRDLLALPDASAQMADSALGYLVENYDSDRNLAEIVNSLLPGRPERLVAESGNGAVHVTG